jgi:hypothetical protein
MTGNIQRLGVVGIACGAAAGDGDAAFVKDCRPIADFGQAPGAENDLDDAERVVQGRLADTAQVLLCRSDQPLAFAVVDGVGRA